MMFKEGKKKEKSKRLWRKSKKFRYKPLTTSIGFALDINFMGSLYTLAVLADAVDGLYLDTLGDDNEEGK